MANKPRTKAKPITEHQLFPAVVALWFGALFGLGSLALRPSLIESLVISSRIDLLVPAAAPPLGVTARILIALTMAAIGSGIGIAIGRLIARPKSEPRERKRGSFTPEPNVSVRPAYANPQAVVDELEPISTTGILAARRRSLALEEEEVSFVPQELAPLPGGTPQILDIASVGLQQDPNDDIRNDGRTGEPAVAANLPSHDIHADAAAEAAAAAADGRQVFGQPAREPTTPAPRQIFGQPIEGDHVSPDFVKAVGFKTTIFESPEPEPLFPARRDLGDSSSVAPQMGQALAAPEVPAFTVPDAVVPPAPSIEPELPPAAPVQLAEEPIVAEPMRTTPAGTAPIAAEPAAEPPIQPSPAGLGMDDLAARLAESMARRRAARQAKAVSNTAEPAAPQPDPLTQPAPVAPAAPAPFAAEVAPAAGSAPVPQPFQAQEPAAHADATETLDTPRFTVTQDVIAAPAAEAIELPPQAPAGLPAALRPLDLDGFEEDEFDDLSSLLPPRKIAFPDAALAATPIPPMPELPADEAETASEEIVEENYASLLGLAPQLAPREASVRIEEPELEAAAVEPVVIFPGQMARPAAAIDSPPFRQFDAPAQAGQGQPVAANNLAPAVDPEESERALRLALANLQRMSGAA